MSCEVIEGCVNEDSAFALMARVEANGSNITQAVVSTVTVKGWKQTDTATTVLDATLTVSSVVFDTLQTDGRWTTDSTGYNFRHDVASTVCSEPGRYRFEHTVTLTTGEVFILDAFEINSIGVQTS